MRNSLLDSNARSTGYAARPGATSPDHCLREVTSLRASTAEAAVQGASLDAPFRCGPLIGTSGPHATIG